MMIKNCDFGIIRWDISVELFLIEVPLDRVEVVPLKVVVAS